MALQACSTVLRRRNMGHLGDQQASGSLTSSLDEESSGLSTSTACSSSSSSPTSGRCGLGQSAGGKGGKGERGSGARRVQGLEFSDMQGSRKASCRLHAGEIVLLRSMQGAQQTLQQAGKQQHATAEGQFASPGLLHRPLGGPAAVHGVEDQWDCVERNHHIHRVVLQAGDRWQQYCRSQPNMRNCRIG